MVLGILNQPAGRVAGYVHVYRAHEDRDLRAFFVKIFCFMYFFNGYNLAIYRRQYLIKILSGASNRVPEELQYQDQYDHGGYLEG
jgi:hypothetical protein